MSNMAKSIKALITPDLLIWGRETAGFSTVTAAEKLKVSTVILQQWESGEKAVTFSELKRIASLYHRPIAVFYLAEPPSGFDTIRDFRRLPDGEPVEFSPALLFLIRRVKERQEWAHELRKEMAVGVCSFVGSSPESETITQLAQRMRKTFGIHIAEQKSWRSVENSFRTWQKAVEAKGILVFQSSTVAIDEMRGFAIADEFAPAVLVNSQDANAGRLFTLMHELCHIFLGIDGVSDMTPVFQPSTEVQKIETFCNAVAAECLVPLEDFNEEAQRFDWSGNLRAAIDGLAGLYSVSRDVIARRMLQAHMIEWDDFVDAREFNRKQYAEFVSRRKESVKELRIPRVTMVLRDTGRAFPRLVFQAYADELVSTGDVVGLLDLKLKYFEEMKNTISVGE